MPNFIDKITYTDFDGTLKVVDVEKYALKTDLSNYVTLDGTQTITGTKTFSEKQVLDTGGSIEAQIKDGNTQTGAVILDQTGFSMSIDEGAKSVEANTTRVRASSYSNSVAMNPSGTNNRPTLVVEDISNFSTATYYSNKIDYYDVSASPTTYNLTFPKKSGTIALLSDVPTGSGITPQQLTTQEISYVDGATSKVKLAEGLISVTYDAVDTSESGSVEINKVGGKIKLYKMSETLVDINGQGSSEPYIKLGGTGSFGCFLNIDADKISSSIWGNSRTLNFPSSSGTLALTSDIPGGFSEITSSSVRIWDLPEGAYKWSYDGAKFVYYNGASGSDSYPINGSGTDFLKTVYLYVIDLKLNNTTSYKVWYVLNPGFAVIGDSGSISDGICLTYGYTMSTTGSGNFYSANLAQSRLNRIPSTGSDGYEFVGTGSSNKWRAPIHYLTCSTAASTAAKTATCTGFRLTTGVMARVMMTNNHTSSSAATLKIDSTGAKNIRWYGSTKDITASNNNSWNAGELLTLVYDGTYWRIIARSSDLNVDAKIQAAITGTLTTGY